MYVAGISNLDSLVLLLRIKYVNIVSQGKENYQAFKYLLFLLVHKYSKKNKPKQKPVNLLEEVDLKEAHLHIKTRPSINGEEKSF